ncbi:MAG TPA: M50 family metallopeptidase [Draconibacterium sp.]|nr:M50 family metallopeptidase [Draconibacterium sp.]
MKETLQNIWDYILNAGIATLTQLLVLLGPLIILALIMNFIARKNENLSYKVLGQKIYLYVFGWLGTSVHELGHAIFAIIFAHKVSEIKLFTPGSGK